MIVPSSTKIPTDYYPTPVANAGSKYDGGKPRIALIDPMFIREVAKVLTFGAQKYDAHNWRKGIEVSRLLDAALRHINDFNDGNTLDKESNLHELGHAACCLMMAMRFTGTEWDDRYKG